MYWSRLSAVLWLCRTVQVAMQDCRFAFDLASRDAIWGAAEHMAAGVVPFKKPPFKGSTTYIKVTLQSPPLLIVSLQHVLSLDSESHRCSCQ